MGNIKSLVRESLVSVYMNKALTESYKNKTLAEGIADHPEALTSCISPEQLGKDLNAELHRKNTDEKERGSAGVKSIIYHRNHIEDFITSVEGEYDVYPLFNAELTPTGKPSKKARKINYNRIIGSYNKEKGFVPSEKYANTYQAGENIPPETAMAQTAVLNAEKFKALIGALPSKIFDSNPKMEKGDEGRNQLTVNTGLPAINGIVFDESTGDFRVVNTCPGAGECALVCYARGGFYGMNDGKILKLMRRLNLLWNNPKEYYKMVMAELLKFAGSIQTPKGDWDFDNVSDSSHEMSGDQLVIRWNDAGDFFSETYYKVAQSATRQLLKLGYNVKSYAYTKQAKFVNLADKNFIMNFSKGSKPSELAQVELDKVKFSEIVPKDLFKDVFMWKGAHIMKVDNKDDGLPLFAKGGAELLKSLMSKKYNVPLSRLKYQWELPNEESEMFDYDVIVMPTGDTDIGAQRHDVHKVFLLVH